MIIFLIIGTVALIIYILQKRGKGNEFINNPSIPSMPASEFFDLDTLKRRVDDIGPIHIAAQNAVDDSNIELTEGDRLSLEQYNDSVYDLYWQTFDIIQNWGKKLYSKDNLDTYMKVQKNYMECEMNISPKANQHLNNHIISLGKFVRNNPDWLTRAK